MRGKLSASTGNPGPTQITFIGELLFLRRILTLTIAMGGLFGCQLIVALSNEQCEVDSDCTELLGDAYVCSQETRVCERASDPDGGLPPLPEAWSCLRGNLPNSENLPEHERNGDQVDLSIAVVEYTTRGFPAELRARACLPSDLDCGTPYLEDVRLDEEGYLNLSLPYAFTGRLEMETPGYMPMLWYVNRPIYEDYRTFGASLVTPRELESISTRSDDELAVDSGLVIFALFDCNDEPAEGLTVTRTDDAPDVRFYFDGPLPDQDLEVSRVSTELSHDMSPIAAGGFFNAKPGFVRYEVHLAETGDLVSTAEVEIRAGHMTTVAFYPGDF